MSVHPEAMAPPKEQSMPAYPGEGEFNPIAFTDEYTYCCGGPGCYVMPDFLCGYLGCPLCCFALPDHTMQAAVDAANYQYGLLGLDRAVLMYKFERADINGKKGFRATEVFRNAEAVDVCVGRGLHACFGTARASTRWRGNSSSTTGWRRTPTSGSPIWTARRPGSANPCW